MQYAGKEVQHASKWGNNELSATVSVTGTTSMYKHQGDLLKLRVVLQHGRMVTTTSMDQALVRQSGAHGHKPCGHKPWDAVHLEAFMGYWGHAARLDPELRRPIKIALQVRDEAWTLANPRAHRRIGRWPNAACGLSLFWRRCRLPRDPPTWELMAANRQRWRDFTFEVFEIKGLLVDKFYPNLYTRSTYATEVW